MVVADIMSARVVCRSLPEIAPLAHVYALIASFLLPSHKWTLERSIRRGYRHLTALLLTALEEDLTLPELEKRGRARKGVHAAAKVGDVGLMQRLVQSFGCIVDDKAARDAVEGGNLEALQWVYSQLDGSARNQGVVIRADNLFPTTIELDAVTSGSLEMLQWICRVRGFGPSRQSLRCAGKCGHLPIVQWLYAQSPRNLESFEVIDIARGGQLEVFKFLYEKNVVEIPFAAVDIAAGNGHVELAQWMHAVSGARCSRVAIDIATSRGDLEAVRWLHKTVSRFQICSKKTMDAAARDGHHGIVKFLHQCCRAEGFTHAAMDGAAEYNHMEVVLYLHTFRNDGCSPAAMDKAATNGHLEMVKWLHQHYRHVGCTTDAMDGAASNGQLHVVQWLHANRHEGCTTKAMDAAASNGLYHVVRWLHLNRPEGCTVKAMDGAARLGRSDILEFLVANRPEIWAAIPAEGPSRDASEKAAAWVHEHAPMDCTLWVPSHEILAKQATSDGNTSWFIEHLPPGWTNTEKYAARQSDILLLEFLVRLGHFERSGGLGASVTAAEFGNVEVLEWLLQRYPSAVRDRVDELKKVASLWSRWYVYEWLTHL